MIFSTAYPEIFIVLCLVFAWFLTRLLYRNSDAFDGLNRIQLMVMKGLRFLVLFLMSVLLLSPVIKLKEKAQNKPVVLVLQDNSSSMLNGPDSLKLLSEMSVLQKEIDTKLSAGAEVKWYLFADTVQKGKTPVYNGNLSDYSDAIEAVSSQNAYEKPVAMMLIGDGIYNTGQNPVNLVKTLGFPVYTVVEGDTSVHSDLRISLVRANPTAFPGKPFPVEVEISGNSLQPGQSLLTISQNGKTFDQRVIQISGSSVFRRETFQVECKNTGLLHYKIQVTPAVGEQNTANNSRTLTVDVLNSQQKILILADAPHPDIGALSKALESDPQFKVDVAPFGHFEDYSPEKYNLIIFYQLPSKEENGLTLLKRFTDSRRSRWFILGSQNSISAFNKLNTGMKIVGKNGQLTDVQLKVNSGFGLFHTDLRLNDWFESHDPLLVPQGKTEVEPFMETLFFQSGKTDDIPALVMGEQNGVKTAVLTGEGIWKWRISAMSVKSDENLFSDWIVNTARYLALNRNKDQFNVHFDRMVPANEVVRFSAILFNAVYEPVRNSAVKLDLTDEKGKLFHYVFTEGADEYELDAGHLPPGSYHFLATTKIGTDSLAETGNFEVMSTQVEMMETRANQQVMKSIAEYSGGRAYNSSQLPELFSDMKKFLQTKSEQTEEVVMMDAIRFEYVLFLLIILLAIEWFLRRYWGSY